MKKVSLVVDQSLTQNKVFNKNLFRDNITSKYILLKKELEKKGYNLSTQDINDINSSEIVIYSSYIPNVLPAVTSSHKSFLILWESEFIKPENYKRNLHKNFKKIFTWHDDFVDGTKYIKINFSHAFPVNLCFDLSKKKKLCVLIAGRKKSRAFIGNKLKNLDLYKEREKAIRWFEKNKAYDFDLYGVGWDRLNFHPRITNFINKIALLRKLSDRFLKPRFPSYRGTITTKKPIMELYKFSICYENARDIPGYITEKIFDSFFAGCVPIYWGSNNVKKYIPEDCFIDKTMFPDYPSLYKYISEMPEKEYLMYLENISAFLKGENSIQFRDSFFAKKIAAEILK